MGDQRPAESQTMSPSRPTASEPSIDRRAERTRAALRDALLARLGSQDLDGLTVAGLCRAAGVHRTTFYGHYDTTESFAVGVLADLVDEAASVTGLDDGSVGEIAESYYATLGGMLDLLDRRRGVYRALFRSSMGSAFREALRTVLRRHLALALAVLGGHGLGPPGQRDLVAAFLSGALASALEAFVEGPPKEIDGEVRAMFDLFPPWWPRLSTRDSPPER